MKAFKKIMVACDLSKYSFQAIKHAAFECSTPESATPQTLMLFWQCLQLSCRQCGAVFSQTVLFVKNSENHF